MFYNYSNETLEQVVQKSCVWPIVGHIEGQVERGFEQIDSERRP